MSLSTLKELFVNGNDTKGVRKVELEIVSERETKLPQDWKQMKAVLDWKWDFFPESESDERWHDRNVQSWGGGDCKLAR